MKPVTQHAEALKNLCAMEALVLTSDVQLRLSLIKQPRAHTTRKSCININNWKNVTIVMAAIYCMHPIVQALS